MSIVAVEPLAEALPSFETCVLVNNNLCGKLVSLSNSPVTLYEKFNITLVPFFTLDFNLFSFYLDNNSSEVLYYNISIFQY